ncbi:hypothetical protein HS088_TW13G00629 [Tripterygium wilfordii]|uniref:DUF4378 domain-containing protein n=1 Tax=Tripterygium wilfordii TaxID=458696 RepID=A0A7J7CUH3_TRIWF|nr:uncharacterized protein LOC120011985 [Tripterygium wilfordii]XP_038719126.1 uncharacterized protein LOC120011985 [Tripterygium wilfordii]KAF5737740.1 hypothetical protein HS088_TW13G00629 [Tripterygium wilfordii]
MSEASGKTTGSSLAIIEKRTNRPGGCVGILFHLFDWNSRFVKKKLFSRRLLPPARGTQVSKKFGDEKMPKAQLKLIADENSGGFPNAKTNGNHSVSDKGQTHEMRDPGLVARLMGLESIPDLKGDRLEKVSVLSERGVEKFVSSPAVCERGDLSLDKVKAKLDFRPQKLQKTGQCQTQGATRCGADALNMMSVLSQSRKHHPPKLAPPVKSPRISSARNSCRASRLIYAATRILEPGLQATNRAKCTLTYSSSMHYRVKDDVLTDEAGTLSPDVANQSNYNVNVGMDLMGQTSYKTCGNTLDVVNSRVDLEGQPFIYYPMSALNMLNDSALEVGRTKARVLVSSLEQEREAMSQRHRDHPISLGGCEKGSIQAHDDPTVERKLRCLEGQAHWHLASHRCKVPRDESSSCSSKIRTQSSNWKSLVRERMPPRAKSSNLRSRRTSVAVIAVTEAKDFISLNRSSSGQTPLRIPCEGDTHTFDSNEQFSNGQDKSLSNLRNPMFNRQTESPCDNSAFGKHRNAKCGGVTGKEMGVNSPSQTCRSACHCNLDRSITHKDSDVVSFTFNSPLKYKAGISSQLKLKRDDQIDITRKSTSEQHNEIVDGSVKHVSLQKQLPLKGDALGALLEQKLKELTCQEEDEMVSGDNPAKRSTAIILQELISALTAEQPMSEHGHMLDAENAFQSKGKLEGTCVGFFSRDADHLSPGSVLEVSSSTDSCTSSCLDNSSGHRLNFDSINYHEQLQPTEPDPDRLDSATFFNERKIEEKTASHIANHVSEILNSINLGGLGLTGKQLSHAKGVILNSELLFGTATHRHANGIRDFFFGPFLLDELESLADETWTNINWLLGFMETKEGNNLFRGFLFDCVIEVLDSKYCQYCNSGFKSFARLPSYMNTENLIQDVGEEIQKWESLVGMIPDELLDWDMNHSLGKWVDFDMEAFENGADIGRDILQILVEEIVVDLWECRLTSFD